MDYIVWTDAMIHKGALAKGDWNKKQFRIMGFKKIPRSGWKDKVIGTKVSARDYNKFLAIKHTRKDKLDRKRGLIPPEEPKEDKFKRKINWDYVYGSNN